MRASFNLATKSISVVAGPNGCGKTYFSMLKEARDNGYSIVFYFLCVRSISLSLKRIKTRVEEGGHDIPKSAVLRRQSRCFENFWSLYRSIADDWYIFENSGKSPKLILSRSDFERLDNPSQLKFSSSFLKGKAHDTKRA